MINRLIGLMLCVASWQVCAVAPEVEKALDTMTSYEAEFTQVVKEAQGFSEEKSSGKVWVQRPGKFNWRYDEGPQKMDIVADGVNLWIYQPALAQVMVYALSEIEKDLPISWLASSQPIAQRYNTRRLEDRGDGLMWFDLQNKQGGTQEIAFIELALQGDVMKEVVITSSDGKETRVSFKGAKRNISMNPSQFDYRPAPNIDIIGNPQ
ncbi:MAG: outer membrane lipoprotein chaperone LolA [Gammaproteobacteria bacterium]|nr:outer membrane lipoprotein chaperone LolA [Gammaproteobacteria bacterium]